MAKTPAAKAMATMHIARGESQGCALPGAAEGGYSVREPGSELSLL